MADENARKPEKNPESTALRFGTRVSFAFSREDGDLQPHHLHGMQGPPHIIDYPEGTEARDNNINTVGHVG